MILGAACGVLCRRGVQLPRGDQVGWCSVSVRMARG